MILLLKHQASLPGVFLFLYAGKTMDELLTEEQKAGMDIYKTACFRSGVFLNEGNNRFRFIAFPDMAQFSNISDILVADMDKDGHLDLIVSGNSSDADVSSGNYDAMATLLLSGDGKGRFQPVLQSGLNARGEVRRIIPLQGGTSFILLKNNGKAQSFTKND